MSKEERKNNLPVNEVVRGGRLWDGFETAYAEVFLVDDINVPTRIGLMKRGPNQGLFPNQFTGTGGRLEGTDTDQAAGVRREWREEMGIEGVDPQEFGRIIIHGKRIAFLFFAQYAHEVIPSPRPQDGIIVGEVEWVPVTKIFEKNLVLTTRCFLEEWRRRDWSTAQSFTLFLEREDPIDVTSNIKTVEVMDGLLLDRSHRSPVM